MWKWNLIPPKDFPMPWLSFTSISKLRLFYIKNLISQETSLFFGKEDQNGRWDVPLGQSCLFSKLLTAHWLNPSSSPGNSLSPEELFPYSLFSFWGSRHQVSLCQFQISLKDDVRAPSVLSHLPLFGPQVLFLRSVSSKTSTHTFLPSSVFLGQPDQQTLRIWNDLWRFWFSFGT